MKRLIIILISLSLVLFSFSSRSVFATEKAGEITVEGKLFCASMEPVHKHTLKDASGKVWNIVEKKPYIVGCQISDVRITGTKGKGNEIIPVSFDVKQKDGSWKKYTYCETHKAMDTCNTAGKSEKK